MDFDLGARPAPARSGGAAGARCTTLNDQTDRLRLTVPSASGTSPHQPAGAHTHTTPPFGETGTACSVNGS